jgi:ABC-type sugar transport system permease subunit
MLNLLWPCLLRFVGARPHWAAGARRESALSVVENVRKDYAMLADIWDILEWTTHWYFWVPLLVLLLILIGVFILLRVMKKDED